MCYLQILLRTVLPWDGLKEEFVPVAAEALEISGVIQLVYPAAKSSPCSVTMINILGWKLYKRSPSRFCSP